MGGRSGNVYKADMHIIGEKKSQLRLRLPKLDVMVQPPTQIFGKQRQEDHEFETLQHYTAGPRLKTTMITKF